MSSFSPPPPVVRLLLAAFVLSLFLGGSVRPAAAAEREAVAAEPPSRAGPTGSGASPGEPEGEEAVLAGAVPELGPKGELGALAGRPIARIEVVVQGPSWGVPARVSTVRPGELLTPAVARRAARELLETGAVARLSIRAAADAGGGVVLRLVVVARRLIASIRIEGGTLDEEDTLDQARIAVGDEITPVGLADLSRRVEAFYRARGYVDARVNVEPRDTDDPRALALVFFIAPGRPRLFGSRTFVLDGPPLRPDLALDGELASAESSYAVGPGDKVDEPALTEADRALTEKLQTIGYHRARVHHQVVPGDARDHLYVRLEPGPKLVARYEGVRTFDTDDLDAALDLPHETDKTLAHLASKVVDYYLRRGFLDVTAKAEERGGPDDRVHAIVIKVHEGERVRVAARSYPCMSGGPLSPPEVGREIDSFLDEELPGGGIIGPVAPADVDTLLGPKTTTGARPPPLALEPRRTYVADTYDRALKHLQDYYRSQGYLSATVGPLGIVRRQCDPKSPPGACIPLPLAARPIDACRFDAQGLPADDPPPDPRLLCAPDPLKGIRCEPSISLRIPIKLGPRTLLYDLAFEGNKTVTDTDLARAADLTLGEPVSQVAIEEARRRVLDEFREEGFAFAEVRAVLDFSPDRTRARARFVVSEGERVVIDAIVVRGARRTDPSLVLRRVALEVCPPDRPIDQCEPYRASAVRKTEERIATLGTFSSVSVSLEDPYVPARRKVAIITVEERVPQYTDHHFGFSTGEGVRYGFEYTHRNIAGKAIQLTVRAQLSYLPDPFILDADVRRNYDTLTVGDRLERRDTISIVFPEVGLGPLVRLGLDAVDVRDNARDFGLTKEAALATFTYRPVKNFYVQVGGSTERNDVKIFNGDTVSAYLTRPGVTADLQRLLRVPDGTTFAVAERASLTWDRRDNSFGATRGTFLFGSVEHVHAFPAVDNPQTITSDFLRLGGTLSGYVRLGEGGLALAASLRGGRIIQLVPNSKTYPDRLFFLGGFDSLRGFFQDALVPQDLADQLLSPQNQGKPESDPTKLNIQQIAIRGGDVFVNPRLELRIPVAGALETALFLDAGNVWVDPTNFNPLVLRYAAGPGIRIATPIGPIAFDYGINLDRRPWEDPGAFHFSIGLF